MGRIRRLRNSFRKFWFRRQVGNRADADLLKQARIDLSRNLYDKASRRLYLTDLNLSISLPQHGFLLKSLKLFETIHHAFPAELQLNEQNELLLKVAGLKLIIRSYEELAIVKEILVDRTYGVIPKQSSVVIDIGMNVGIASLYFALNPKIEAVWGFEPFPQTFEAANSNLALNPQPASKIKAHCVGVGASQRKLQAEYSWEWKGSSGIEGYHPAHTSEQGVQQVEIAIEDIAEIMTDFPALYPGRDIIIKMDCEGAEYEIIDRLKSTGQLGDIRAILIEWHYKGPEMLVETLSSFGFVSFSFPSEYGDQFGMIYASR